MLKKCLTMFLVAALTASVSICASAANNQVAVSIPSFSVSLNELKFDNNDQAKYPLLVYRDITYFPMTYYQSQLLNLSTAWTAEGGLVIEKGDSETPKLFSYESVSSQKNSKKQNAAIIDSKVTVNGKVIDNKTEMYPLLLFRDITYFPLTWRFAVEEFGWNYSFDNKAGLRITADNLFYTTNGDSLIKNSGEFVSVDNETHYIKGNLRVYIKTETNRLGPVPRNLHIINNGVETTPEGYFGYYQKNGPLFSIDGSRIRTTYYTDPDARDPKGCSVNIETGQIETYGADLNAS